jgi:hypothetical protein
MHGVRALLLCGLVLAYGCSRAQTPQQRQSVPDGQAPSQALASNHEPAPSQAHAAGAARPLGEFEPLSNADVALYLQVMRTAAQRVRNMSAADRDALRVFRAMTTSPNPNQAVPSPEQIAAVQRAGVLMALDASVARELGVAERYRSVLGRVDFFVMPSSGEGDPADAPQRTAEQKQQLKLRIERFAQLRTSDAAILAPHRDEIVSLQKQVNLALHPESIPR